MKREQFKIEHMDPMGQGVSKIGDKITFIGKTLPLETGIAAVYKEQSKIQFAAIESIDNENPHRQKPTCPHFDECPSCHYLHTSYQQEILFKEESLNWLKKNLPQAPELQVHPATNRLHYRNRIQLHYRKKEKIMGMLDSRFDKIVPIPNCLVGNASIQLKIKELYQDEQWLSLVSKEKNRGHIELYDKKDGVGIAVNQRYAHGGFTQINSSMNQLMIDCLDEKYQEYGVKGRVLDIFGGSGNISSSLIECQVSVVDSTPSRFIHTAPHQNYIELNLYKDNASESLFKKNLGQIDTLILDPPRSGLKSLDEFIEKFNPRMIFYVSCLPSTLLRDLKSIQDSFELMELHLFDFFPSTYHFETMAILRRK